MKHLISISLLVFCMFTLRAQIGLESNLGTNGTYLQLENTGLFTTGMNLGLNYINTFDPIIGPNVLKLQSTGLGNVTIGATNATGTGAGDAQLIVRASNEANMDLRLEGDGKLSTHGDLFMYLDDNNTSIDAFHIVASDGFNLLKVSEDYNHVMLGNLALGFSPHAAGYMLSVDGKIISEEVRVELSQNWPDYVFKDDYELTSLNSLEKEIKTLGHLPGIPSAKMVEKEGFDLGEMNRLLLEKIEELTLHVISLNKEIEKLKESTK